MRVGKLTQTKGDFSEVKARIVRLVNGATTKNENTPCVLCGEFNKSNKGKFELALACGYTAEAWICRSCSGAEHTMRTGSIELPYVGPHYHVRDRKEFTFWDFRNTLDWVYEFWQRPPVTETRPGIHVVSVPKVDVEFFRCEGKSSASEEVMKT